MLLSYFVIKFLHSIWRKSFVLPLFVCADNGCNDLCYVNLFRSKWSKYSNVGFHEYFAYSIEEITENMYTFWCNLNAMKFTEKSYMFTMYFNCEILNFALDTDFHCIRMNRRIFNIYARILTCFYSIFNFKIVFSFFIITSQRKIVKQLAVAAINEYNADNTNFSTVNIMIYVKRDYIR